MSDINRVWRLRKRPVGDIADDVLSFEQEAILEPARRHAQSEQVGSTESRPIRPCPGRLQLLGYGFGRTIMLSLSEPYQRRTIRFLELWNPPGWQMKLYGVAYSKPGPQPELILAAKKIALQVLSSTASQCKHYGIGFMGIHEGRGANFVFVDWWADENAQIH